MGATKKLPERKCVGCQEHFEKRALVRVVRQPDGTISFDETGKLSGRGVYLCKKAECLKKARRSSRLEHSLECKIPEEIYERLEKEFAI